MSESAMNDEDVNIEMEFVVWDAIIQIHCNKKNRQQQGWW